MRYEIAKELKEAGFPQAEDEKGTLRKGGSYLFPRGMNLATSKKKFDAAIAYAPTLTELIEMCAKPKFTLILDASGEDWSAEIFQTEFEGEGKTPEEAVAKLWLALNKK